MLGQLEYAENIRCMIAPITDRQYKAELGQFMTPSTIAKFMASMFIVNDTKTCNLLDAGAGIGVLSCAFLDRWAEGKFDFEQVNAHAYEVDRSLSSHLVHMLSSYNEYLNITSNVVIDDFIESAATMCKQGINSFTHVIMNPPYKKINSNSDYRLRLRSVGIETVNMYSAFVALAISLLAPKGQIVAIIPRSFCNGPYYKPFRDFIFKHTVIRQIHLFNSRSKAFKDDNVLQENIILLLERGENQSDVVVTTSSDDSFSDLITQVYPFERIVSPNDAERFIHVPTAQEKNFIERSKTINYSLKDIGLQVSTGPVVDFRLKKHLRNMPDLDTVPLLYPAHFTENKIEWPKLNIKKPNAIQLNDETEKWLYPRGFYCIVRRFSSKEEKRRIVARVVQKTTCGDAEMIGFENHLNVYHENKHGLSEALAHGLSVYLNTTGVDENFRLSSGHTQVNATDLKMMKYPSRDALIALGEWAMKHKNSTQSMVDEQLNNLT